MHALIIEDDYLIAQTIEDHLRDLGFSSFSFARSQDAAVVVAREQHPALITADVRLLPGSGIEAVNAICTHRPCATIFVTGFDQDVLAQDPAALVVRKPIKKGALAAAVREAMKRSETGNA